MHAVLLFSYFYLNFFSPPFLSFPPTVVWFIEDSKEEGSYDTAKKNYENWKESEYRRKQATVDEASAEPKVWELSGYGLC